MVEPYSGAVPPQQTAPELMANELRRAIALGALEPGARLPSERTLAERLGVSRMTVRAAMRILARDGLVTTLRGRSGGTVVASTASSMAHADTESSIHAFALQVRDNLECRLAVEPLAAALAAERATDEERETLLSLVEINAKGIRHYRMLDSRLHMAIAHAAHNESLLPIIETLRSEFFLWADAAWARLDWDMLSPREQDFGHSHRSLVLAITAGRQQASRRLMQRHIEQGLSQIKAVISSAVQKGSREHLPRSGPLQSAGKHDA